MEHATMKVGDLEIIPIHDGYLTIPEPSFVSKLTSDLSEHRFNFPGDGTFRMELGAFLVRTADRVVLIDAGMGPPCGHCGEYHASQADPSMLGAFDDMWRRLGQGDDYIALRRKGLAKTGIIHGKLDASLRDAGCAPEEITDVVLSHLHPDHMGWVAKDGQPYFPKADIWVHEADVGHFLGDNSPNELGLKVMFGIDSTKERIQPALPQLRLWSDDRTIAPGIDVRHMPGHTPGSSIAVISSQGQRAMLLGDIIHCPLEMTDDEFEMMSDLDRKLADESRMAVIREIEDGSVHVASNHFPGMRFGRLLAAEGKRYFTYS